MPPDVVGVGANSLDYVYRLPSHPEPRGPLAKLRIAGYARSPGGQTATTLSTCAAMGLATAYVGTIGSDENGRQIRDELERRGVDLSHSVARDAPNPFALILIDERTGERVVLWDRPDGLRLGDEDLPLELIRGARLLHVDDVDQDAAIRAADCARAAGIPVTSDLEQLGGRAEELLARVTFPIFAEEVPAALTGESDPERALRKLRRRHDGLLSVTLGSRGAMALDGDRLIVEPGHPVAAVDTTGAGDVFRGAFIVALLGGDPPADILRFANAAAAVSCTRHGAIGSVPGLDDVRPLLAGRFGSETRP